MAVLKNECTEIDNNISAVHGNSSQEDRIPLVLPIQESDGSAANESTAINKSTGIDNSTSAVHGNDPQENTIALDLPIQVSDGSVENRD